jgi:hypothetical protein
MQKSRSLNLFVPPHTPDITMDHRVKPGGDAVGSLWSILHVACRVVGLFGVFHNMSRKHMPLYVAEFQFRYNYRAMRTSSARR